MVQVTERLGGSWKDSWRQERGIDSIVGWRCMCRVVFGTLGGVELQTTWWRQPHSHAGNQRPMFRCLVRDPWAWTDRLHFHGVLSSRSVLARGKTWARKSLGRIVWCVYCSSAGGGLEDAQQWQDGIAVWWHEPVGNIGGLIGHELLVLLQVTVCIRILSQLSFTRVSVAVRSFSPETSSFSVVHAYAGLLQE